MSDRKLTLLELHFDDGLQIGPKTIGLGGDEADGGDDETDAGLLGMGGDEADEGEGEDEDAEVEVEADATGDEGGSPMALLVGVVALAAVAAVVRRLLGEDETVEIETPDETEDVEEFESTN